MGWRTPYVLPAKLVLGTMLIFMSLLLFVVQIVTLPLLCVQRSPLEWFVKHFSNLFGKIIWTALSLSSPFPTVAMYGLSKHGELVPMKKRDLKDIFEGGSSLLVSNHVGAVDSFIINKIAQETICVFNLKYVVKNSLKWIPGIGWAMYITGYLFLKRSWSADIERIKRWCAKMRLSGQKQRALVLYPEGSRWTEKKHKKSQAYAKKRGYAVLESVLYPKVKGFALCINALQNTSFDKIVHLTIVFVRDREKAEVPSLSRAIFGEFSGVFKVLIKKEPMRVMEDPLKYLEEVFVEKDKEIERLIETKV
jgi:1-acyl-sn-glycerol-3-phosphate acyltransferase